ncbi:phage major tail tube protein [Cloacibacillus sp.]|uniref:phage major tail tube protein n=1 Tax=Cloacibacillus sp. TaxID=2049023 RepID=UPI0025B80EFF|nr:phage major tail tube protein [Cloacibacillus sp.]MCC8056433.1 phage major tail tube protein [Cloacibacillus sp.]
MPKIPDKNINFNIYNEDNILYGVAEVTLPDFEAMAESMSGAGIAGEAEIPVIGHFGSMGLSMKWRTVTKEASDLMAQKAHSLECRGSVQRYNAGEGKLESYPIKITTKAVPKKFGLGSLNVGKSSDSESSFEILYIKVVVDGAEVVELDKYNYIFRVNDVDYLESIRKDLGLGN